jgi:hypothetical protein
MRAGCGAASAAAAAAPAEVAVLYPLATVLHTYEVTNLSRRGGSRASHCNVAQSQDRVTDSSDNNAMHAHSTMRMVFKEDIADDPYTIPIGSNGRTDITSIASHVLRINQKSINQSIPNSNNPSRMFESRLIAVRPKISLSQYRTARAAPHVSPRDLHSRRDPCAVG